MNHLPLHELSMNSQQWIAEKSARFNSWALMGNTLIPRKKRSPNKKKEPARKLKIEKPKSKLSSFDVPMLKEKVKNMQSREAVIELLKITGPLPASDIMEALGRSVKDLLPSMRRSGYLHCDYLGNRDNRKWWSLKEGWDAQVLHERLYKNASIQQIALNIFMQNKDQWFRVGDIAEKTKVNFYTVKSAVDRLLKNKGLLEIRKEGSRCFYRFKPVLK